jgi:thymidine phosphorylase
MKTLTQAKALASLCRAIGARFGKRLETIISTMDQPLGTAVGHTVEILEVIETLQGKGSADLEYLCLALASVACVSAGLFPTTEMAWISLKEKLHNGEALRKFEEIGNNYADAGLYTIIMIDMVCKDLPIIFDRSDLDHLRNHFCHKLLLSKYGKFVNV